MQASRGENLEWLRRSKCPVAAVSGATAVAGYDAKMIRGVRSQTRNVRTDVLVRVTVLGLRGSCGAVTGRRSVFKMYGRTQSMRIDRAIECG